jgi:G:T/U-mismatch repair DNA glycosylase
MMNAVAPAVKPIWDFGYAEKLTDENWETIKKAAADLTAAIPTISAEPRASDPKWQDWTMKVSASADAAMKAANAKDQMALAMAGDALVEQCEGCHMAFDPTAK